MKKKQIRQVALGKTGLKVSQIGFGGLPLKVFHYEPGMKLVYDAKVRGINFFDTAHSYGSSEDIIGKGLFGLEKDVVICSKTKVKQLKYFIEDIETSFQNLKVSYIDIFMLHDVREVIGSKDNQFLSCLEYIKDEEEFIRFTGISSHRMEILHFIVDKNLVDVIMFPFNYIETEALTSGLVEKCRKNNIGMVVMKPIGGGVIRYPEQSLEWIAKTLPDAVVIPGMKNLVEVENNLKIFEKSMKFSKNFPELLAEKERLNGKFCHRCEYCLPCPIGINPSIIIQWREFLENRDGGFLSSNKLKQIKEGLNCKQCGECESKCPYGLKLTELVPQETRRILEKVEGGVYNENIHI